MRISQRSLALAALAFLVVATLAIGWWLILSQAGRRTVQSQVTSATQAPPPTAASATPPPTSGSTFLPLIDQTDPTPLAESAAAPTATATLTATAVVSPAAVAAAPSAGPKPMSLADWPPMAPGEWPRPANDNGLCIHNIADAYFDEATVDRQISRLKALHIPWTVVLYGDENQLMKAAPRYRDAGIMVVWRKWLRADEPYYGWGRDVALLRELGVEPYMQIYNEPSLPAEWLNSEPNLDIYLKNFISAVEQVYNAGGYVGVQSVDDRWLVASLQEIKRRGGEKVFGRMFLIPHPYGLNHPPDYTEDTNGVLGFLHEADLVAAEIGFVPPMIAGEGGWKWNAGDDSRFPRIDATVHRDYHLAVFDWFRTGVLSNGQPLPDYLLAFCPWLLSAKLDDSAWFDSFAGDHTLTIEAVQALPAFQRQFTATQ